MNKKGFLDLDTEIFSSPAYWILTGGVLIAIWIGFGAAGGMGGIIPNQEYTIPMLWKIIISVMIPIIAYFITMKFRS